MSRLAEGTGGLHPFDTPDIHRWDAVMDYLLWSRFARQLPTLGNVGAEFFAPYEVVEAIDPPPLSTAVSSEIAHGLAQAADDVVTELMGFNSHAVVIAHGDHIIRERYADGYGPESLLQSQSMHKTVQALLVGIAIDEGLIEGVEEHVGRFIPEWSADPRGNLGIAQLLGMRSGLETFSVSPNPRSSFWKLMFAADSRATALSAQLVEEPGTRFDYNDINAAVLGMVIEASTGGTYAHFLRTRLAQPLGIGPARVWLSDEVHRRPHTECCLLTPARTWLRIGMMMRDGGRFDGMQVVPAAWIDQMCTPAGPDYDSYGYLTWLDAADFFGPPWRVGARAVPEVPGGELVSLSGYGGQRVWISRSLDTVIVRQGPSAGRAPLPRADEWDDSSFMRRIEQALL